MWKTDTFEEQRQELLAQFDQERRHWEQEKEKIELDNSYFKNLLREAENSLQEKEKELAVQVDQELETSMIKVRGNIKQNFFWIKSKYISFLISLRLPQQHLLNKITGVALN